MLADFTQNRSLKQNIEKTPSILRVVFCSYPGIFADTVMQTLTTTENIQLVGVVYSTRIFSAKESWLYGTRRLINTSGLHYAGLQFLQTNLYLLLRHFFGRFCPERYIPVYRTKNINTAEGLTFLTNSNPDVVLLANFNQKISAAVISLPHLACLNIHPSLLPAFKGVDPVFAAMYANEKTIGVTVHQVDEEFDTGGIILQTSMATKFDGSVFYHQLKLFQQGAKLAAQIINGLPASLITQKQSALDSYDSWPTRAKIKSFRQRGGKLITIAEYISALKSLVRENRGI